MVSEPGKGHLSRRTVEAHLRSIYRKIGVTTRAAAIRDASSMICR
ncbi:LuxR C-terminal-related transcriptional regulator [Pseudonocardia sp. T1-2H]